MPLQNRVTPAGEIVAVGARGLFTGNRGCLHREDRTLGTSRWRSKLWITCTLDWRGRRRDVMPPGRWTALFFLDEATSLAAGHRPCAYCRRSDYLTYVEGWQRATGSPRPRAYEMDAVLHRQRVEPYTRRKVTYAARPADLPDGAMVDLDGPALWWRGRLLRWTFEGYGPAVDTPGGAVRVLTPAASVAVLAAGYRPVVHPSAIGSGDGHGGGGGAPAVHVEAGAAGDPGADLRGESR
jgi:hypothetical protein